jgi:predicted RNA-binding protein with PIN domain
MLVDGYNVIRSGFLYQHLASHSPDHSQDAFNAAREALLGDVAGFAGRDMRATVVFDGAGNPGSEGERQHFGPVEYLFSPFGVSADTVIEQRANAAAKEGLAVLVVTSDATLQWTVFGKRVTRMSAAGFCEEIEALRQSLNELSAPGANTPAIKNTLAERIDPKVSAKLERFARGRD